MLPQTIADWLSDPSGRPIITYRGPDGGRIELSARTARNTVIKVSNFCRDELLAEPGDAVLIDLPLHWQAPVLILGTWAAGLRVALPGSAVRPVATMSASTDSAQGEPLAVSLDPWGMPLGSATPAGWRDLAAEVRIQPDAGHLTLPPADEVWLSDGTGDRTGADLLAQGESLIAETRLPAHGRLATTAPPDTAAAIVAMTVAPALAGGSVILADGVDVTEISEQERSQGVFNPV